MTGSFAVAALTIGDRCTACGACLATCPEQALEPAPKRPGVRLRRCTGCGECVEVCPRDAIVLTMTNRD
ncbi:MAG: 4Fe-4S binding protein [Acidimicrobiales bacterium]